MFLVFMIADFISLFLLSSSLVRTNACYMLANIISLSSGWRKYLQAYWPLSIQHHHKNTYWLMIFCMCVFYLCMFFVYLSLEFMAIIIMYNKSFERLSSDMSRSRCDIFVSIKDFFASSLSSTIFFFVLSNIISHVDDLLFSLLGHTHNGQLSQCSPENISKRKKYTADRRTKAIQTKRMTKKILFVDI